MDLLPFVFNMDAIYRARALLIVSGTIILLLLMVSPLIIDYYRSKDSAGRPKLRKFIKYSPSVIGGLFVGSLFINIVNTNELAAAEENWAKNAATWSEIRYGVTDGVYDLALLTIRDGCNPTCVPELPLQTRDGLITSSLFFVDGAPKLMNAGTGQELAKR